MKKPRRMAAIIVALIIAVSVAGCGGNQAPAKEKTEPATEQKAVETEADGNAGVKDGTYILRGFGIPDSFDGMYDFEMWCNYSAEHSLAFDDWTEYSGRLTYPTVTHEEELNTYENRKKMLEDAISMYTDEKLIVEGNHFTFYDRGSGEETYEFEQNGNALYASYVESDELFEYEGEYKEEMGLYYIHLSLKRSGEIEREFVYFKDPEPIVVDDSAENVYGEYGFSSSGNWLPALSAEGYQDECAALFESDSRIIVNEDGTCTLYLTFDQDYVLDGTYNEEGRTITFDAGGEQMEAYYFAGKFYMKANADGTGVFVFEK